MDTNSRLNTLINSDNYMKTFQIEVLNETPGTVSLKVMLEDRHMRSGNVVNGGIMAGLFDIAGALSIFTIPEVMNAFTISLNVNFLEPLSGEYCILKSSIRRVGGKHAFIEMENIDKNGKVAATAHGIWAIVR